MLRRSWLIIWCALGTSAPLTGSACSCPGLSLEDSVAASDNVFTALVTGGTLADGRVFVTFETTEVFKGSIPFEHLESHVDGSSCGRSFAVGYEYLVFAPDDGQVGLCSGIGIVSPEPERPTDYGVAYVQVLRAKKAGRTQDLAEPWAFADDSSECALETRFPTGWEGLDAWLRIEFRHSPPATPVDDPESENFQPGFAELAISVPDQDHATDFPVTLRVGVETYDAYWRQDNSPGRYVLRGDDVLEFTKELVRAERVLVSSKHSTRGPFEAVARTSNIGTSASDMLRCMSTRD